MTGSFNPEHRPHNPKTLREMGKDLTVGGFVVAVGSAVVALAVSYGNNSPQPANLPAPVISHTEAPPLTVD